jgi:NTE family protein
LGLVLTGGGARGAYQAGALKGIFDVCGKKNGLFSTISGISAGAINGAVLASLANESRSGVESLCDFWSDLTTSDIYRTDVPSLMGIVLRWITDLTFGGIYRANLSSSLLDSTPLRDYLIEKINFERIHENIKKEIIDSFSCCAFSYSENKTICFFDTKEDEGWERPKRRAEKRKIQVDHILASSAIPLFFRPIKVGDSFYGDGCMRNLAALSPVIHLGAD